MSPSEFKSRFIAGLPKIPAGLDLKPDEFFRFPATVVDKLKISKADKAILTISGLPKDAAPFLSFGFQKKSDILKSMGREFGLPDDVCSRYKMIGFNGSGDMICINDSGDGAVVYLNHDRNMEVVFMNSGVVKLAECLCLFHEFQQSKDGDACRRAIRKVDPKAMGDQSFWRNEIRSFETADD
jgi:hypothetical protein